MKHARKNKRTQYTAELIPLAIYKGNIYIGNGYVLVREDGLVTAPILFDGNDNLLPEVQYLILPAIDLKYLVIVPEMTQ